MNLNDMLEQGITIQGRFVSVIDADDDTVYYGDGESLHTMEDKPWMRQDVAFIYPSIYHPDSIFIELR